MAAHNVNILDILLGAAVAVALGIGGWLFRWSRVTDTALVNHTARILNMEKDHTDCIEERKQAEQEIWDRFNERMDAMTAQLSQIAQSIGQLQGALDRPRK